MMEPLITRNDIVRYKQIAKTSHDDKLNEMILDAQLLDIQPLLGEEFYNKVISSPADHADLLNGCIYEYDGISYTNYGLKMVLAYFAYSRYVMFSSITDTPFSVVEKLNGDSRPADRSDKKTIYAMNREAALQLWGNVKNYLVRTNLSGSAVANAKKGGLRFKKLI